MSSNKLRVNPYSKKFKKTRGMIDETITIETPTIKEEENKYDYDEEPPCRIRPLDTSIGVFSMEFYISNAKTKKVSIFNDATDNFAVKIKIEKVGGDYIILDTEEWNELQVKKLDIESYFNHPGKLSGITEVFETPKHSVFMKNLYGQKCLLKRHQPWTDTQIFCQKIGKIYESKVVLQESTWRLFLLVLDCLQTVVSQRQFWQPEIQCYFSEMCNVLKNEFIHQHKCRLSNNNFSEFFFNNFVYNNINNLTDIVYDTNCPYLNLPMMDAQLKGLCQGIIDCRLRSEITGNILDLA